MTITIQKEKLERVDEKIILLNVIGCLEAVKNGGITVEEAEKFIFSPHMIKRLKEKGYNDKIVELISKGCELEDIVSLMPQELENVLEEMKQEAIEIVKEYEPIDEMFWVEDI